MKQITAKQSNIKTQFLNYFSGAILVVIICSAFGFKHPQATPAKGDVIFKNCGSSSLDYYFVVAAPGAKYDFCGTRLHFGQLYPGKTLTHPIDSGKVLEYRFYNGTECNSSAVKATGTLAYDKATGQTIEVGCK